MKKLYLLLVVFQLVSCGGDDDSNLNNGFTSDSTVPDNEHWKKDVESSDYIYGYADGFQLRKKFNGCISVHLIDRRGNQTHKFVQDYYCEDFQANVRYKVSESSDYVSRLYYLHFH